MKGIIEYWESFNLSDSSDSSESSEFLGSVQLNSAQSAFLKKSTSDFKKKLIEKSLKFSELNKSFEAYNLVHTQGEALNLTRCFYYNCFDASGNWNLEAPYIEENAVAINKSGEIIRPKYQEMMERIDDTLYPNILPKDNKLNHIQKMILCALVYEIQTQKMLEFIPNKQDTSSEKFKELTIINQIIYHAARVAVTHALFILTSNIASSLETETDNTQEDIDRFISQLPHFHAHNKKNVFVATQSSEEAFEEGHTSSLK